MGEFELAVKITTVGNRPELWRVLVDSRAICPQLAAGLHFLKQKAVGVSMAWVRLVDEVIGQLA